MIPDDITNSPADKLAYLKDCVQESHDYFKANIDRFNEFQTFVYSTALTASDIAKLQVLQKPAIEFNILEAYISRQMGEFSEHEPGLTVSIADSVLPSNMDPQLAMTVDVIEGHTRDIINKATNDGFEEKIYRDLLFDWAHGTSKPRRRGS